MKKITETLPLFLALALLFLALRVQAETVRNCPDEDEADSWICDNEDTTP